VLEKEIFPRRNVQYQAKKQVYKLQLRNVASNFVRSAK
jgi:hypothetical protein